MSPTQQSCWCDDPKGLTSIVELTALQKAKSKYSKSAKGRKAVSDYYFRTKPERQKKQKEWRDRRKVQVQIFERFYNMYKDVHPDFL